MNTQSICPSCQKPLPEGAPKGLCPECLMKAGFPSETGQPGGNPRFAAPPVDELARLFPQLEVLQLVGQGGMGAVYKARQPGLDRLVAIKILPPQLTAELGFAERFAREARTLARLNHPNIVAVYDFGKAGELHYFIMEYVDGLNLRELERGGRLSPRGALELIPQICDALQFAHDEGIVHRDIKPENVMVDKRGRVKVTDFGLAKLLGQQPRNLQLTGAKDVMGTPNYMAPEQMERPQEVDHRADIYSLGVVFYELLTGELPLGKFAPPSAKVQVDVRLDEIVLHTLEREPLRRYQHASQVKSDVETVTHSRDVPKAPPLTPPDLDSQRLEDARRQVYSPATGLLITAILNWIGIPCIVFISAFFASQSGAGKAPVILLPLAALILSSVMLVASLKMKRLQAYWLAVTGSVLAILVTPGNILGLPVGIWSLVVLSQRHVRESFGKGSSFSSSTPIPQSSTGGAWKVAAVIVAAVLLIAAIPVGLIVLSVALPALHRAKARAQEEQVANLPWVDLERQLHRARARVQQEQVFFAPQQATLNGLETGRGSEGLDLDTGIATNLPPELRNQPGNEGIKWLNQSGVDLVVERVRGRWGILTTSSNELKLTSVPDDLWLNPGLQPPFYALELVLEETLRRGDMVIYVLSTNARPPLTFSYQTGNGGSGILQFIAFGEDPEHAKVQFRRKR
jgi:serine/threonine protein kinase